MDEPMTNSKEVMDEPLKDKLMLTVDDMAALKEDETATSVECLTDRMRGKIVMGVEQADTTIVKIVTVADHQVDAMKNEITIAVDQMRKEIIMAADKVDPIKEQMILMTPPWLQQLLETRFFFKCEAHKDASKAVCNRYCLDCMGQAICSRCVADHKNHHIVQIRKLSYHNAIRVSDVNKFINISSVQTYTENSEKVVFLHERPQSQRRLGKGATYTCEICRRSLIDSFRFCSLGCKLRGIEKDPELTFIRQGTNNNLTRRDNGNLMQLQGMIQSSSTQQKLQNNSVLGDIVEAPTLNWSDEGGNHRAADGIAQDTLPITNYRTLRRKGVPHRARFS